MILLRLALWAILAHCCQSACAVDDVQVPAEISQFTVAAGEPVFLGQSDGWDKKIRERGWIMREGAVWRLWYTGYDPDRQPPLMRLGYATSPDGLHWTRHQATPLVEYLWIEDMMVVRQEPNGPFLMFAEGLNDQAQLLVSRDGIQWERQGPLDVRLTTGEPIPPGPFGTPTAYFEDGVWHLFYERRDAGIWMARSTDLKVWTNISDQPLISPGPDEYDRLMIAMNQIIKLDGHYYAVMHGTGTPTKPRQWCTTLAVSDDLIHWKKYTGNPLLPIADNKSSGQLVHDGTRFRLYTMHDKVELHLAK